MGNRKLGTFLFRRSFRTSKFKAIITVAVCRIAQLKSHHHIRWCRARSDVVNLLTLGHRESALLRVDSVIREQNMFDALVIIEDYCGLMTERIALIKQSKTCPDELKEAISSLIFAASRCGELPELYKIYKIFMSKFGKQFANSAIELRNDCGVSPKIANKFPTRRPSLGTRLKVLAEIASEDGITLRVEEEPPQEKSEAKDSNCLNHHNLEEDAQKSPVDERLYRIMAARNKYKDVPTAAQAAFELSAHAAAAAIAALELSQSKHPN